MAPARARLQNFASLLLGLKCGCCSSVGFGSLRENPARRSNMLRWALIFFVVALLAAVLGFTGIAVAAAGVAKVLFFLFVILFLVTLLGHVARRP